MWSGRNSVMFQRCLLPPSSGPHSTTSQKTILFKLTTVRTWNFTIIFSFSAVSCSKNYSWSIINYSVLVCKFTREGFLLTRSFTSSALIVERLACLKLERETCLVKCIMYHKVQFHSISSQAGGIRWQSDLWHMQNYRTLLCFHSSYILFCCK
jgi:hypothetical protein